MISPVACGIPYYVMNAFDFGKFVYTSKGVQGISRVVTSAPARDILPIALGAASYYNPYIAAITAAPVVYNGAKWLINQVT